jgi:transcriptional regulator with XRE-family HTH domain
MGFGERLKKLRLEYNMTQEELGQKLFVSKSAISSWEKGAKAPDKDRIADIAKFFNVSTDYLLGFNDNKSHVNENVGKSKQESSNIILDEFSTYYIDDNSYNKKYFRRGLLLVITILLYIGTLLKNIHLFNGIALFPLMTYIACEVISYINQRGLKKRILYLPMHKKIYYKNDYSEEYLKSLNRIRFENLLFLLALNFAILVMVAIYHHDLVNASEGDVYLLLIPLISIGIVIFMIISSFGNNRLVNKYAYGSKNKYANSFKYHFFAFYNFVVLYLLNLLSLSEKYNNKVLLPLLQLLFLNFIVTYLISFAIHKFNSKFKVYILDEETNELSEVK